MTINTTVSYVVSDELHSYVFRQSSDHFQAIETRNV
jgi:hypothetical protein